MIKIIKIEDPKKYNEVALVVKAPFSQSYEWGEILLSEGKKVERVMAESEGRFLAVATFVYMPLFLGFKYAFSPKGPVGDVSLEVLSAFEKYLKAQGVVFWRIETKDKIEGKNVFKTRDINPAHTMILDLQKSEEEILSGMHSKTRYNIHLAEKKSLELKEEKNLPIFYELMKKTGERDGFRLHDAEHYQAILESDFSKQLTVYSNNKAIATMILIGYGDTFTYLFGASDHEYRQLMAPYLLQWGAIQLGKKSGYKFYDFFGVAPNISNTDEYEYDVAHQYGGVSRFKGGFGADYFESAGTFDVVISLLKYKIYSWLRKVKLKIGF